MYGLAWKGVSVGGTAYTKDGQMASRKPARTRWLGLAEPGIEPSDRRRTPPTRATSTGPNWPIADSPDAEKSPLDDHYEATSHDWTTTVSPEFGPLVVPTGNATSPIHRWFHFKEAYSHRLLGEVAERLDLTNADSLHVIDPFSGVGTTLLSAVELTTKGVFSDVRVDGVEINPFLRDLAATKIEAASQNLAISSSDLLEFLDIADSVIVNDSDLPDLSTFKNSRYFDPSFVRDIVALRLAIDLAPESPIQRLARLALAMTVEPASRLRRDGRALRYEDREALPPRDVYARAVKRIIEDLDIAQAWQPKAEVHVHLGSASDAWHWTPDGTADLVMFSPPYPNNIDYTEVYKTELWALGYVNSAETFREQRHRTLRSHPSVKFEREVAYKSGNRHVEVKQLIQPILAQIPSDSRYAKQLERLISGYADDMLAVMDSSFRALRPGGSLVYIVGNSVHGTKQDPILIASDVILARLGEIAGFEVVEICAARSLPRRRVKSAFVRESVVFLAKPRHPEEQA